MSIQVFRHMVNNEIDKRIDYIESASIPGLKRRLERIIASYENVS